MNEIQDVLIPNSEVESQRILDGARGYLSTQTCIYEKALDFFSVAHNFRFELIFMLGHYLNILRCKRNLVWVRLPHFRSKSK